MFTTFLFLFPVLFHPSTILLPSTSIVLLFQKSLKSLIWFWVAYCFQYLLQKCPFILDLLVCHWSIHSNCLVEVCKNFFRKYEQTKYNKLEESSVIISTLRLHIGCKTYVYQTFIPSEHDFHRKALVFIMFRYNVLSPQISTLMNLSIKL